VPCPVSLMFITDFAVHCTINTNGSNSTEAIRDDGSDVTGTSVTLTAGTPALYEATGLTVAIAAGSLINIRLTGQGTTPSIRTHHSIRYRYA